jgi:uncharacterized membrane protein (DUF373 family)
LGLFSFIERFEDLIKVVLMGMMLLVITAATVELGVTVWEELEKPPFMLLNTQELVAIFGYLLMILIGLELLETIKAYFKEHAIHTDVVFLVALIALVRKVIILDVAKYEPMTLIGVAALIFALSTGYYLFKRTRAAEKKLKEGEAGQH